MEITAVENTFRIRRETQEDYRRVEELTRRAFWNLYVPGCSEHYLAHILRDHADFIPELDLVAELEGSIIGNIMYTKASLTDEDGTEKPILTFGPISVLPEYQRQGCGKALSWGTTLSSFSATRATMWDAASKAAKNTTSAWKTGAFQRRCW